MRLFKYKNRRLYAPDLSRYINAPEVMDAVKRGVHIQILCHKTRNDITAATLVGLAAPTLRKRLSVDEVCELVRRFA